MCYEKIELSLIEILCSMYLNLEKSIRVLAISLMILCLSPMISFGQMQVSNIENYKSSDDYPRKGFVNVGDNEYYIEQGKIGTKVWLIQNSGLQFLHELKFRPSDSNINLNTNFTYDNNSNLIYDGHILFEFYTDYIYLVDIVKGEVIEIVDLRDRNMQFPSNFYFGTNYFYFDVSSDTGWSGRIRFDRNTKKIEILNIIGSVYDSKLYSWGINGLLYLDLETNKQHTIPLDIRNIKTVIPIKSDANIHFVFQIGQKVYRLLADNTIDSLACQIPEDGKMLYYCNQRLVYGIQDGHDNLHYCIKDLSSCEDVYCEDFFLNSDNNFIKFRDLANTYNDFIFIAESVHLTHSIHYIYDIKNNHKKQISTNEFTYFLNNPTRIKDNIYFTSSTPVNLQRDRILQLYKLNLETSVISPVIAADTIKASKIIISDVVDGDILKASYEYDGGYSVVKIENETESIKEIFRQEITKNIGMQPQIKADLWVENKYFAATCDAVFMIDENRSVKILDIPLQSCNMSNLIRKNDHLYLLVGDKNSTSVLKINVNNLSHTKINLPRTFYIEKTKVTDHHLLVNYPYGNYNAPANGYFDMNKDLYVPMDSLNGKKGRILEVSGNNILYLSNGIYILDQVNNKSVLVSGNVNVSLGVISDDKGGFYLNVNKKLCHINGEGQLSIILEDFEYTYLRSGKKFSDNHQSYAFHSSKELVIVTIKNGIVRKKSRGIDPNTFYAPSFFWYESEDFSFIEILDATNSKLFYITFDTEPKLVSTRNRSQKTILMMENKDEVVFAYSVNKFIFQFDKMNLKTRVVSRALRFEPGFSRLYSSFYRINDDEYVLNFDDGTHGLEPWVYNMATHQFDLLKDINVGHLSSDIMNFTTHPITTEVYFTALRSEGDRQLFKIKNIIISTDDHDIKQEQYFTIFPVPSTGFIMIDNDLDDVIIHDVEGKTILNLKNYHKGDWIELNNTPNGIYHLSGFKNGHFLSTKSLIIMQ